MAEQGLSGGAGSAVGRPVIEFDKGVIPWIRARGGHLLIHRVSKRTLWGFYPIHPRAEVRRPHDPWRFVTYEAEGVRVHVERRIAEAAVGPLRIGCIRLGPLGRAWVRGLPRLGRVD